MLVFAAIAALNPAVHAQTRRPVDRSDRTSRNFKDVALRTRIATDDGALVIYDAPQAEGKPPGHAGYLAYWKDLALDEVFVYRHVIEKRSDAVHALLWLRHDFGVDPQELATNLFTKAPELPQVESIESVEGRAWFPATRRNVMIITGLWPAEELDAAHGAVASGHQIGPGCWPCAAATAGGNAGTIVPPSADVYEAAVMLACFCCDAPECPICDDNNQCTNEWCEVECMTAYCNQEPQNCNDANACTNDGCNSQSGCYHTPKNCNDGDSCTADTCWPDIGCPHNPRCSVGRKCCPNGTNYFCCAVGEDVCCPTDPAYVDHCCPPERPTCCGAGCCLPTETCCNGVCGLKGACCNFETGSCSELTSLCCAQQGGAFQGGGTTCSPADLCRPKCENCQSFGYTFQECFHWANAQNGEACQTNWCIVNEVDTAGCIRYPHREGPPKCNTKTLSAVGEFEFYQTVLEMTCPAQTVDWNVFWNQEYGCADCWPVNHRTACGVGACSGPVVEPRRGFGNKKVCGCQNP